MSELREHLALIRENWDRHDHWFDALCNNLVRGHMKELERLSQVPPEPVGEVRWRCVNCKRTYQGRGSLCPERCDACRCSQFAEIDPLRSASPPPGCDAETIEACARHLLERAAVLRTFEGRYQAEWQQCDADMVAGELERQAAAIRNLGKEQQP